jgi:hypothetical protein
MGKELFQRDVQLIDHLVKRRCSNMFSRKVVLAFPYLASIRRADSEGVTVPIRSGIRLE